MKTKTYLIVIFFCVVLLSCEKEEETLPDPTSFLSEKSVSLSNLAGEWIWLNTHGGYSAVLKPKTPETEGYTKSLLFSSSRTYLEIIDKMVFRTSYFKIDTTREWTPEVPIFKMTFFDEEIDSVKIRIDSEDGFDFLYLYDISNCRDCAGTSVFRKLND